MDIYELIYDSVNNNLQEAGIVMEYQKTTFISDVKQDPQNIDLSRVLGFEGMAFVEAMYVIVLKRLPDQQIFELWNKKIRYSKEKFQKEVIRTVFGSVAATLNHMKFCHNPYFAYRKDVRYYLFGLLYGLTDKSFLREFGKKMPLPIQKIIRKIFL